MFSARKLRTGAASGPAEPELDQEAKQRVFRPDLDPRYPHRVVADLIIEDAQQPFFALDGALVRWPSQRQAILNSDRFRGQFSDQERNTISNLLAVEPYLPVRHPNDNPWFGK